MKEWIGNVMSALAPVWIGAGMAYLLNPVVLAGESVLRRLGLTRRLARGLVLLAILVGIGAFLFVSIHWIVPQLVATVSLLREELPQMSERLTGYLTLLSGWSPELYNSLLGLFELALEWINTNLFATVSSVTRSFLAIISGVFNVLVGIIFFFYVQLGKERLLGQAKKLLYAVCPGRRMAAWILEVVREAHRIFGAFLGGKLVDSDIIGLLCFLGVTILRLPYAVLVSVIVGVTNIVPVLGPFIGGIPCAILIFLASPTEGLVFALFILLLQQLDGNLIGPRILGSSTGLSAMWVTVAILLFGKLLGFAGMILGVPLFAIFYYIVKRVAEESLEKRGLPRDTESYMRPEQVEEEEAVLSLIGRKAKELMQRRGRGQAGRDGAGCDGTRRNKGADPEKTKKRSRAQILKEEKESEETDEAKGPEEREGSEKEERDEG